MRLLRKVDVSFQGLAKAVAHNPEVEERWALSHLLGVEAIAQVYCFLFAL